MKLNKMKEIILLLMISFGLNGNAQEERPCIDSSNINYALIEDGVFYLPKRAKYYNKASEIYMKNIKSDSAPFKHYCPDPFSEVFPFTWCKSRDYLFNVAAWYSEKDWNFWLYYRNFQKLDSIEERKLPNDGKIKYINLPIAPLRRYINSFYIGENGDIGTKKLASIINQLSFDIIPENQSDVLFFLRDENVLYVWNTLDKDSKWGKEWYESAVYINGKEEEHFPPFTHSKSYSGKFTHQNAIKDSLFFDGHFKVIKQNGEQYIINRKHGFIYHIGEKKIKRIGKVIFDNNYPKIQSKAFFIEDRDANELIFFAPIEWEGNRVPKPKVKIMTEAEMKKRFEFILN